MRSRKVRTREDAFASTRDARATQAFSIRAVQKIASNGMKTYSPS
jgi:hypothetical protein